MNRKTTRGKKGQSSYDRPTEDRLASTSRIQGMSTESFYKKVLELESFVETSERATTEEPIYLSVRVNNYFIQ